MATLPESNSAPNPGAGERRGHVRLLTGRAVRVMVTDGSNRSYSGKCVNVSVGGFGLELDAVLAVGEVIDISLDDAAGDTTRFRGRVVYRTNQRHYGVALLSVSA